MEIVEITRLSKIERLKAMEAIWDSLLHEDTEVQSPAWHQDVLAARKQKIAEGTALFRSIDELRMKQRS